MAANANFNSSSSIDVKIYQLTPTTSILPKPTGWWKSLTSIYQIYPASFYSTHATPSIESIPEAQHSTRKLSAHPEDEASGLPPPPTTGLGDIQGIIAKLPYLKDLGVEAIWLSPVYTSPLVDMGYDVADYTNIDPRFGTLNDLDDLVGKAHDMGMRVLMDLVINHTSDRHRWFQESCKSRQGQFADFYIWKDARMVKDASGKEKRQPPNNWGSVFGGPAWEWVEARQQYYLHLFDYRQPDLNWEMSLVRQTIYNDAIRFWLDRGIDGFRVDTCGLYSKDQSFADGKVSGSGTWAKFGDPLPYVVSGPRIHEFWAEIRREALDRYGDVLMIGELGAEGKEEILKYVDAERKEMSCVFSFELTAQDGLDMHAGYENVPPGRNYTAKDMKKAVEQCQSVQMEEGKKGWCTVFMENHDVARSVSRFGDVSEEYRERSAKLLAMLVGTLSGTFVMYQGQEIGMSNIPQSWSVDDLRDLASIEYYERKKKENPGDHDLLKKVWRGICAVSRDNARTPMQWSGDKYGGFGQKPWMRVNDEYKEVNVENQQGQSDSVLHFWRKMLQLRKEHQELLIKGGYRLLDIGSPDVFAYEKMVEGAHGKIVVVLNPSDQQIECTIPETSPAWKELLSTTGTKGKDKHLQPWEGRLYRAS